MKHMNSHLRCLDILSRFTALAVAAVFLCCCEKEPEPLFDNGMIHGKIDIFNPGGYLNGNDVRVIAHGPYRSKSTLSDYEGNYELSGLGNGTYEIEFNKEGYGIYRVPGVQIFGNDTFSIGARLYKMADYKMPGLGKLMYSTDLEDLYEGYVAVVTDITSGNFEQMQIRVFLSDTKNVSFKNYMYSEIPYAHEVSTTMVMVVNGDPQYPNWGGPIFPNGTTRYMIAYVCSQDDQPYFNEYYALPIYSTVDEHQHSGVYEIKYP
jgi:hypothetical protein